MSTVAGNGKTGNAEARRALLAERLRRLARERRHRVLSFGQQRLWFIDQLEPHSALYNVAAAATIEGAVDPRALENAINAVIRRQDSLRTHFVQRDENPEQVIAPRLEISLERKDLRGCPKPDDEAQRIIAEEVNRPFDLEAGPLIRVSLITIQADIHRFLLVLHHIIADEWSLKIFFNELAHFYREQIQGSNGQVPELPIRYADFAEWQHHRLEQGSLEGQREYWRKKLKHPPPPAELMPDRPRQATSCHGANLVRALPAGMRAQAEEFARRKNATVYMVLLAVFKAVLARYTQQDDILIGSPIAGRNRPETQSLIGFFVNTLALRTDLSGDPTFEQALERVRETTLGAFANQELPFEKIVEELQPERSLNQTPFVRTMFVLQNGLLETLDLPGATFRFEDVESRTAKFDLTLFAQLSGAGLTLRAEYNRDLFESGTIERFLESFEVLLQGALNAPDSPLSRLPLLSEAEKSRLLVDWNQTTSVYPRDKCIGELFEAQVARAPEATAAVFAGSSITYEELNHRANQLAGLLKQFNVGPDVPVCICVHRSFAMLTGVLGILKAGGAYVPLDPRYPKDRLRFMLQDTNAPVLLTQQDLIGCFPDYDGKIVCLDADWDLIAREGKGNVVSGATPENLAYIMYTSGSTGQPKGVAVPHRAVNRLVLNTNYIRFDPTDRIAQVSNFSFDAATFEIWGALLNGAQLIGINRDVALSPREFADELKAEGITAMFLTSALFNQLAAEVPGAFQTMRTLIAGGEALDPKWVRSVLADRPPRRLVNGYGPTENTTFTCCHWIEHLADSATNVPIGKPIANTQVYILDKHLQPVPVGVPGELYTGGDGLARGYWQRPDLTAEKFVPNPFARSGGSPRLYKTGDLARFLPDGSIEFLGRIDHQVKIRGFRIELGEIETALGRHPAVRECVVIVKGHTATEKKLLAYFVSRPDAASPNASELRSFLLERLPEFMVPSSFVPLAALPLTDNGKLDRAALPAPDQARPAIEPKYVPPGDEVELQLARIWETVLKVHPVGIQDKFFDLGGHSLLAVRLIAQIEKAFGRKLRLATIFQAPTVQQLAAVLRQEIKESSLGQGSSVVEIQSKGSRPPLFLVHGAGGGMFWGYVNLAQHLGPQQPVYGFKSRGLDGRDELDDLGQIAAEYVADLRKIQPAGPYYLGGYCFGGIVAYEMARQIVAAGDEVRFLGLLNCAPPNSRYTRIPWNPRWALRFLRNLAYWANYCRQWTPIQRREFIRWKWSLLKSRLKRRRAHQDSVAIHAGDLVDLSAYTDEQRRVWEAHIRALVKYHPAPYSGAVHLFRSPGHPLWCSFDPDYGWGGLVKGGVHIKIVPGAHEKILEEGCVEILAGELSKTLEKLDPWVPEPAPECDSNGLEPNECSAGPAIPYETDCAYAEHFQRQARIHPAAVAVDCAGEELTYAQLDARANQLAHFLKKHGVGPETLVGICLDRSLDLPVALLGVAKAGGAYLPLDPEYPIERLAYMLSDSKCGVLLTHSEITSRLPKEKSLKVICLDDAAQRGQIESCPSSAPQIQAGGNNLAYVIYTSGSTGAPKGVEISNAALLNHNFAIAAAYELSRRDRVLQFAPLSFDISVEEMFPTWLSGATVVLRTQETLSSTEAFLDFIARRRITMLNLPTAFWHELVEFMHSSGRALPDSIRLLVIGGEKASEAAFLRWNECVGGSVKLINGYGVTEATITNTLHAARPGEETLPIGRPIANTWALALDERLQPIPPGSMGELFIGGAGVSRGYLNRPQLTEQKFVRNPFRPRVSGAVLYRTGDLVRLREDGVLEYIGRIDDQVKIRGYRIELGEIENALQEHPAVKASAVAAWPDRKGNKRLVAYFVPRNSSGLRSADLVSFLKSKLPAYMVPSAFVTIPGLPLTPAGKIDRHALPPPANTRPELQQEYVAPRNETEEVLARIWSDVLSVDPVGINDNFFDLGGHSLVAIQLLSRIRDQLKAELSLKTLFANPTIGQLAAYLSESAKMLRGLPESFQGRELPISSAQRRIWFLETFEPSQAPFNRAVALRLKGPLNVASLKSALTTLARRHDALRTSFPTQDGQPRHYLADPSEVRLPIIDLRAEPEPNRQELAFQRAIRESARLHILSEPMLKPLLFRLETSDHLLVLILNELAADLESVRIVLADLSRLYEAFLRKEAEPQSSAALNYEQAIELLSRRAEAHRAEDLAYWKRQLEDAPPALELPADRPRSDHKTDAGARWNVRIPPELGRRLHQLSIQHGCDLQDVLLAGFTTVLHRYTGSQDIVVGHRTSLRDSDSLKNVVGPFENSVALRCDIRGRPSFEQLLRRVHETLAEAKKHAGVPFAEVVEALRPERNPTRTALFQVMFGLEDTPLPVGALGESSFEASILDKRTAQVDLRLTLFKDPQGSFSGWIEYSTDLFAESRIARFEQHLLVLLEAVSTDPASDLATAPLLTTAERELLAAWNNTQSNPPCEKTLVDLLSEQVSHSLEATALVFGAERLTYAELWRQANAVAEGLRQMGAGPGALIGICLERSPAAIVALLGTLVSGSAYVPLDPDYPKERLDYIIRDARLKVLLTQLKLARLFPQSETTTVLIEELLRPAEGGAESMHAGDSEIPVSRTAARPSDLAYVIYTSGSTGRPKGVAIEHRNAVALIAWARTTFTADELQGVLAATSICFDLSIFEIFVPLCCGGKIVLARNALALPSLPAAAEVTLVNTVPSAIRELLRLKGVPASVRVINLAGEPLPAALADQIYAETSVRKVYDLYGPTETTTYSTGALRERGGPAVIGRPLANEQVWILDANRQVVPVGVPGELYIGGAGVAREYLNRPDLTADRFVAHPYAEGQRLYKTGDLARWREDGNLEYLGRLDHQVKIRGFRIELGEIEAVLKSLPLVREAVVIAREDRPGDKWLAAYVVPEPPQKCTTEELRDLARRKLPDYMVPGAFVLLDRLPLTPNGKLDRAALPVPGQQRSDCTPMVAPRNLIEEQLSAIWRDVLRVRHLSIHDNFFNLGGHSLLAVRLISRIREVFKLELPLFSVFTAPTIAELAEGLASGAWTGSEAPSIPLQKGVGGDKPPLSFVQERLWFLQQIDPASHAYNVPVAFRLNGPLSADALESALNHIIQRHEALRTTFCNDDGLLWQSVASAAPIKIDLLDLTGKDPEVAEHEAQAWMQTQAQRTFNLERGPLIRASLARLGATEHLFTLVMHHTISDGWSLAVLLQELTALYDAITAGEPLPALPDLPVQYADYAAWRRQTFQGPMLERHLDYWRKNLSGAPPSIHLPADELNQAGNGKAGVRRVRLPAPVLQAMSETGQKHGATPFVLLMSALAATLSKWTGQNDLVIGTVVAGRNIHEVEDLIGCFMNFLPLRCRIEETQTGSELIAATRKTVLDGQEHQECPFQKIVEAINPERRQDRNPLYNVALLLQNFPPEMFASRTLKAAPVPVDLEQPLLDLRFEAEQTAEGFILSCEYRKDRFSEATVDLLLSAFTSVLENLVGSPESPLGQLSIGKGLEDQARRARSSTASDNCIAVTATFTAEPLLPPLKYWIEKLELPAAVEFAPYSQVFQELLDPGSLLGRNTRGLNLVLIRLDDWLSEPASRETAPASEDLRARLNRHVNDFLSALKTALERSSVPYLVCLCPERAQSQNPSVEDPGFMRDTRKALAESLRAMAGVHVLDPENINRWYPVADYYDATGDELGHVPYTPLYFTALATAIARTYHAMNRPAAKVIAVDCDHTLWSGVCGEDGAKGICLDAPRKALQLFLRDQLDAGMLLVLCSKNNPEDVEDVFAQRADMPLHREHFAAMRLNWNPKSENLKAMAAELNLGLDSFIFLDDNPLECAEVEANCPGLIALQLPDNPREIPDFLNHCWVFDRLKVTAEDRQRAQSYRQNIQREQLRASSATLSDFLASLDLKVEIEAMAETQIARVAQLSQRTNQFNTTTRRRTEPELRRLLLDSQIFSVCVRDRFGDYGLTGALVFRLQGESLEVDSFMLSCRVLGRGVEHLMLARLGKIARTKQLKWVDVHFVASPKNKPALNFLDQVGAQFKQPLNGGYVYRFPAGYASEVLFDPQRENTEQSGASQGAGQSARGLPAASVLPVRSFRNCRSIALESREVASIHKSVEQQADHVTVKRALYAAPRNAIEKQLCEIWQHLLRVENPGVQDNFFELGGHSLLAVRLFSEIEKLTGRKLPLVTIFQAPTIEQLAAALSQSNSADAGSLLVPIQPKGSKPPLFLVHGAGGDVLWGYVNLAAHLDPDQPVYGIKSRGQIGLPECSNLVDMARCYLEAIRSFQPEGPYYLGGYCFGGNVAYEIARQLRADGRQVALVALLDSAPSNAGYESMAWWRPSFLWRFSLNLREWLRDFSSLEPAVRRKFLARKLRSFARKFYARICSRSKTPVVDLEEIIDLDHFPENELKLWQIHLQALVEHADQPYEGNITLLRTGGQPLFCSLEEDFCWGKLARGGVNVVRIPGSHENIFMEPNVRTLARELTSGLAAAAAVTH